MMRWREEEEEEEEEDPGPQPPQGNEIQWDLMKFMKF
jgi:hypothetical protein